ncbi:MAG: adenylate kinase [Acidimicrobiales bacterium]
MVPGARLVVLGKQGAGKGTQCVRLSHHYVVPHVSTGDMLRAAVKQGTPLGKKAKDLMDKGELLSDDLIMDMVSERLNEGDVRARGFVLDGCPRTVAQADALAGLLAPMDLDLTIDIEVSTAQVLRRLAARRVCVDCGANYSVSSPPLISWTCDVCSGEVVQREDDREEAISRRLEIYERQTAPLIEWYHERNQLATVNGSGSPDSVTRRLVRAIEDQRDRRGGRPVR